jgi:hypothetical protein
MPVIAQLEPTTDSLDHFDVAVWVPVTIANPNIYWLFEKVCVMNVSSQSPNQTNWPSQPRVEWGEKIIRENFINRGLLKAYWRIFQLFAQSFILLLHNAKW